MNDTRYTDGAYLAQNPDWHLADAPWKAEQIAKLLRRNALRPATCAEVGCGAGGVLAALRERLPACSFAGYDISPQALALARERQTEGLTFHESDFFAEKTRFDLLLLIDVIEHVEDVYSFLRALRERASRFVFHIPLEMTAQTVLRGQPLLRAWETSGHLHFFNRETALKTLARAGFSVRDECHTASSIELPNLSPLRRLINLPIRLCFALAPHWTVRALGGYSLLVLAEDA